MGISKCFSSSSEEENAVPIILLSKSTVDAWIKNQESFIQKIIDENGFIGEKGELCYINNDEGSLIKVLYGIEEKPLYTKLFNNLPFILPEKSFYIDKSVGFNDIQLNLMIIGWGISSYQFLKYKEQKRNAAILIIPKTIDSFHISNIVNADYFVKDLINTPGSDMNPLDLLEATVKLADEHNATIAQVIEGELLKELYPGVYAVGKSKPLHSVLIDMRWGNKKNPKLTLVGKGVCFDTGGLGLKPDASMRTMKNDMSGAAHALGVAKMIMEANLPVRLRVIIPAVENSINEDSYKPGDVITMRNGITVEVHHTDAEGRIILADALSDACSDNPELLIDFSTLTGAAMVALGTDIASMFTYNNETANEIKIICDNEEDYCWQMPLYERYSETLKSNIATIANCTESRFGDSIKAALFLSKFVDKTCNWVHLDFSTEKSKDETNGYNGDTKTATLRGIYSFIRQKFSKKH